MKPAASRNHYSRVRVPLDLISCVTDRFLLVTEAHLAWMILLQAGKALRDKELIAACTKLGGETDGQRSWLQTRIKQAAPQALLVDV